MAINIIGNILKRINQPDLVSVLAQSLSGTELNSVLLEVFDQKARSITPAKLLNQYQSNRFVKPVDLPVMKSKQMEMEVLKLFEGLSFEPIELSPVSVLGSCSVVAPASQMKILSALRGTEVLADSTNAIALHASDLRQRNPETSSPQMKFCNVQRQLRTQSLSGKGFTPHFRIGCLVTCGSDRGEFIFERTALLEHMQAMKQLFLDYYKVDAISFRLLARGGYENQQGLLQATAEFLHRKDPDTSFSVDHKPAKENNYYKGIQYKVDITAKGKLHEIGDGGFVDWTQQLLQNKKERMLSTGFGFDLMVRILEGQV